MNDDDGLTAGDRDAIAYHEALIESARSPNEIHRNRVIINGIRKRAKDRQAEGIEDGDADGFTRTGGGRWVTRLLRFATSRPRFRLPQELLHGDRQIGSGAADASAQTSASGTHADGVDRVLPSEVVGATGVQEVAEAAVEGAVPAPGLGEGHPPEDGDGCSLKPAP